MTDEELAQEYLNKNWVGTDDQVYIAGLQKGRELEAKKALRFAEFMSFKGLTFYPMENEKLNWYGKNYDVSPLSTEDWYASKEFAEYLKQFEK